MKILSALIISAMMLPSASVFAGPKRFPHIQKAFRMIKRAENQLKTANDHEQGMFGGHRNQALQHLQSAETEVKAALQYARSHASQQQK